MDSLQNTVLSSNSVTCNGHFELEVNTLSTNFTFSDLKLPFQAVKLAYFFTVQAPFIVLHPCSSNSLFGGHGRKGEKNKVPLIHLVQIRNFHLSDALWGPIYLPIFFNYPHLFFSASS